MQGLKVSARVVRKWGDTLSEYRPHALAMLDDGTGQIRLNLWRGQVGQVEVGDMVSLKDAFARGRKGVVELSTWEEPLAVGKAGGRARANLSSPPAVPEPRKKGWMFP